MLKYIIAQKRQQGKYMHVQVAVGQNKPANKL